LRSSPFIINNHLMRRPLKITIGVLTTLFVLLIALFFFFRYLVTKSFPEYEGELSLKSLHGIVEIYRDEFAVPHIFANDEKDLMFAVGYTHAQDRLWQMDIMRRAGEGRLSEVLGRATIDYDRLFRTIDIRGISENIEYELNPEIHSALQAYADGVNAFINSHKGKYPIEFDMIGYEPEPWQIYHSILLSRLMAWELNLSWWVDLTLGRLVEKVGIERASMVFPNYPSSSPTINFKAAEKGKSFFSGQSIYSGISSVAGFMQIVQSYRKYFNMDASGVGSNSWVIDSSRSLSGKPIIANDPHLTLPAPSKWFEMHLTAPGWNVAGVSFPGSPFIIIGHNAKIAWALTNAMIDESDFYIEKLDSTKLDSVRQNKTPLQYLYDKKSIPIESHEEIIRIGKDDSITINVRRTHHGPIISDVYTSTEKVKNSKLISMRWAGSDVSKESYALYLINKSNNAQDFVRGVREFAVPGQNISYADVDGNIGYWTAAKIPLRGKYNSMLPLPGWSSDYEWKGYVPFEQLPKSWNPKEGFIATANNKIENNSPYYISNLYMPPSRIERIRELLNSEKKFSADDFKRFQNDYVSPYAKFVTHVLLKSFELYPPNNESIKSALEYLKNWDFKHSSTDIASTIFNVFFVKLLHNTFEDEMGIDLFNDYVFFSAVPINVMDKLLQSDNSVWFDDINTERMETKDDVIQKSLSDAVKQLQKELGSAMKNWQWGNLHTITFEHPIGTQKYLDKIFNIGPFKIGGSSNTINNGEYNFSNPYKEIVGSSTRIVVDMAKPLEYYSVITTGQSGQPLYKHYDDQTTLWLNGVYRKVIMDENEIKNSGWRKLTLTPTE
jgi:penicillin amidase